MSDHARTAILCPFVTVTPTIQSGTVVRWFTYRGGMESCRPMLSASRENVTVHDAQIRTSADMSRFLHLLSFVHDVMGSIINGEDVNHLATHERRPFIGGDFVPVQSGRTEADR